MSRVHHIELQCRIDSEHEAIQGEMSDRRGNSLPFSGWTEFATALVALTSEVKAETADEEFFREPRK